MEYRNPIERAEKIRQKLLGNKNSLGHKQTPQERLNHSKAMMGNKNGLNHHSNLGRKASLEERMKNSKRQKGEKSNFWKGGINPINDSIRKSIELRLWRESVFARDNFTCQKCLLKIRQLNAHHINNFADYPELRTSIENGITFCKPHHKEFHKKYGVKNNTKEQLLIFIKK